MVVYSSLKRTAPQVIFFHPVMIEWRLRFVVQDISIRVLAIVSNPLGQYTGPAVRDFALSF